MKKSTKYKILFGMDILLIILWPFVAITTPCVSWAAFLAGAIWVSDIYDAVHHWREIHYYTKMGD